MDFVCRLILDKGELQVSEKEREVGIESAFKDICTIIAEKCVDKETKRPYTVSMITKALQDIHFNVNPTRNAKQQALEAIKLLTHSIPIERAMMRLRLSIPSLQLEKAKEDLTRMTVTIENQNISTGSDIITLGIYTLHILYTYYIYIYI